MEMLAEEDAGRLTACTPWCSSFSALPCPIGLEEASSPSLLLNNSPLYQDIFLKVRDDLGISSSSKF